MEEPAERSSNKVKLNNIDKLKEMFQKWQNVTIGAKAQNNDQHQGDDNLHGIPPELNRRLKIIKERCDSDEEHDCSCRSPEPSHGVPKGYLAVYVGPELRRFIIPTSYLSDPLFKVLLEKVEEEFGFDHNGAITIPCEIETFKYLLQCMENHQKENNTNVPAEINSTGQSSPGSSVPPVDE